MFYHFHQNNSGGTFSYDYRAGISCNVIIEADSASDANDRAKSIGLYFDGIENGYDCECCGDRWHEQWEWGGDSGSEYPEHYGAPAALAEGYGWREVIDWEGFIHFKDGRKVGYANNNGIPGLEYNNTITTKEISA